MFTFLSHTRRSARRRPDNFQRGEILGASGFRGVAMGLGVTMGFAVAMAFDVSMGLNVAECLGLAIGSTSDWVELRV